MQHKYGIEATWIEENGFQNCVDFELYIMGFYWAATILATVGFGDIVPLSTCCLIYPQSKKAVWPSSKSAVRSLLATCSAKLAR